MRETPERQSAERMGRNYEAEMFVIASRKARIEPTLPRFHEHLRRKKAVASVLPIEIIGDEIDDGEDGGDSEEEAPSIIKRSKQKRR